MKLTRKTFDACIGSDTSIEEEGSYQSCLDMLNCIVENESGWTRTLAGWTRRIAHGQQSLVIE